MDDLKEANERRRIAALPAAHFQPLLDLLPQLRDELPKPPPCLRTEPDGTISYVPMNVEPVSHFIQLCYALEVVVPIDWNAFVMQFPFPEKPELINHFSRFDCIRAITAMVRGERFNDGLVDGLWRKGIIARVVARLSAMLREEELLGGH